MAKTEIYHEVCVRIPAHTYPVLVGRNILEDSDFLRQYISSRQVLLISNKTIAPLYLPFLEKAFSDRQCDGVILDDGEEYKNQNSLFQIYDTLIAKKHHRDTSVVALGGGVIGDISGFAAATWQRGVPFVQIPTTLLAQVDASVGGKTAINYSLAKNMIGAFHQPKAVIMDLNTLATLPIREFRSGLAEIIKYAILVGGEFLTLVYQALQEGLADNACSRLPDIIRQCCEIKAAIVEQDERESGVRALLNLGHTFAHALESYTHYKRWLHGEAVSIGLYCAALLSQDCSGLDNNSVQLIDTMLALAVLPRRIPKDINLDALRAFMDKDKKIKNNELCFIVIRTMGDCHILDKIPESSLWSILQCAVEGE